MTPFYRKLMDLESQRLAYSFHLPGIRMFFVFWGEFFGVWQFSNRNTRWSPMPTGINDLARLCGGTTWKRAIAGGRMRTPQARAVMVVRAMQKELGVKSFGHIAAWAMGLQDEWETMNPHAQNRLNTIIKGSAKCWGSKRRAKFVRLYITQGEKEAFRRVFPNMNPTLRNSYREATANFGGGVGDPSIKWFFERFRGPATCKLAVTWDQLNNAARIANRYEGEEQATFPLVCRWLAKNPTQNPGIVNMKAHEIHEEGLAIDWRTLTVAQLDAQYQEAQEQRRQQHVNFRWAQELPDGVDLARLQADQGAQAAKHLEAIKHFATLVHPQGFTLLTTQAEYQAEGRDLGHCVGTYWMHRIGSLRGPLYVQVWSIEMKGERATLSLYFNDKHELIKGGQLYGPRNGKVSDVIVQEVKHLCELNNWPKSIIRKGAM